MKKASFLFSMLIVTLLFTSCKSHQQIGNSTDHRIVNTAKKYLGTSYKWGGTTHKGMDCSGLVYTIFLKNKIKLPRVSKDQSKFGKSISIKKVAPGDLLFFKTDGSWKINHSAIVVSNNSTVKFIHSTTSRGVIISSLNEKYWKKAFHHAQRVLKPTFPSPAKTHKVQKGETLYSISKKFNTTVERIKRINRLNSNTIQTGMNLKVF
ncbi:C40 family peptidase [Wenyingzhuangia sp. IMCC45574]